jgi:hypothetical protein
MAKYPGAAYTLIAAALLSALLISGRSTPVIAGTACGDAAQQAAGQGATSCPESAPATAPLPAALAENLHSDTALEQEDGDLGAVASRALRVVVSGGFRGLSSPPNDILPLLDRPPRLHPHTA